jgi:hypothetical protein
MNIINNIVDEELDLMIDDYNLDFFSDNIGDITDPYKLFLLICKKGQIGLANWMMVNFKLFTSREYYIRALTECMQNGFLYSGLFSRLIMEYKLDANTVEFLLQTACSKNRSDIVNTILIYYPYCEINVETYKLAYSDRNQVYGINTSIKILEEKFPYIDIREKYDIIRRYINGVSDDKHVAHFNKKFKRFTDFDLGTWDFVNYCAIGALTAIQRRINEIKTSEEVEILLTCVENAPLELACKNGHINIIKLLLTTYPKISITKTAFYYSCFHDNSNITEYLYDNCRNKEEIFTPEVLNKILHFAVFYNKSSIVNWLLENYPDHKISTQVLLLTTETGNFEIVKSLQNRFSTKEYFNNVRLAIRYNHREIVDWLIKQYPEEMKSTLENDFYYYLNDDNLELIRYLVDVFPNIINENNIKNTYQKVSSKVKLGVLKWMTDNFTVVHDKIFLETAFINICNSGSVVNAKYLYTYIVGIEKDILEQIIKTALTNKHFYLAKWLRTLR